MVFACLFTFQTPNSKLPSPQIAQSGYVKGQISIYNRFCAQTIHKLERVQKKQGYVSTPKIKTFINQAIMSAMKQV